MSENVKVEKINENTRAVHLGGAVYTMGVNLQKGDWSTNMVYDRKGNWESAPAFVKGFKVVPYGANNDLPVVIRKIMDDNALAPGILERHIGLLYGNGPAIYRIEISETGQIMRKYVQDSEIQEWLKSWDFRRFLDMAMVEYKHMKGFFVRRYLNRGGRIGANRYVRKLNVVPATTARFEWPEGEAMPSFENVKHICVGDFENNCLHTGVARYPIYNHLDPFANPVTMSYHNSYSFARNLYSVPSYFGALKWILRSSEIPDIIRYLTENGISAAFHIHSPSQYWDRKLEQLRKKFPDKPDAFLDQKLDEIKEELFNGIVDVLVGKKNAGKFIETVDFYDDDGNLCSWKVEPIDQKIKDFIDAQIKIGEKADSATTSSMGLHPALSNIILDGQFSSGSQLLYALKAYMASDVNIPEEIIFEPINQAIEANFPNKGLKVGFYRDIVKTENETAPSARLKNNV